MASECTIAWMFEAETEVPESMSAMLVEGERALAAFTTFKDVAVFTTLRIMAGDVSALRSKKVSVFSLPYTQIVSWTSTNATTLDLGSEIDILTPAARIQVIVNRALDVRAVDRLIAQGVLRG